MKALIIVLCVVAVLTVAGVIVYNRTVDHYIDQINVVTKETDLVYQTEVITEEEEPAVVIDEPDHNGELNANNLPLICDTKHVTNILLLAVDSRKSEAGRTDSMIVVSVNTKTNKIVLCSFMRDLLVKYPAEPKSPIAGKYSKLNHAHAYGGPELTMAVLKETFNIDISYYAKVNFAAFRDIVDAMGGVEMELSSDEAKMINRILRQTMKDEMNHTLKVDQRDYLKSTNAGVYRLTGVQALSHARNRTTGSDYARTQRQRDLIQAMAKQATTLSLSQLNKLLNKVLPMITTNLPKDMLKEMVGNVPSYLTYGIESTRVPGNGMFTEKNYNLIPDLQKNCNALYELIYGEAAPQPSQNSGTPGYQPPAGGTATTTTKAPATSSTKVPDTSSTKVPDTSSTKVPDVSSTKADTGSENETPDSGETPKTSVTAPTTTTKSPESTPVTTTTKAADRDGN